MGWHWGVLASSGGGAAGAYELISTTVLSTATASVTFNSIPANTYKHLQLRVVGSLSTATNNQMLIRFNGDSGTNYAWHSLTGDGAAVASTAGATQSAIQAGIVGYNANTFSGSIIDILDYSSTAKNTTVRSLHGVYVSGGLIRAGIHSGVWLNTAAVSSIVVSDNNASFASGSRFSLYGIKG